MRPNSKDSQKNKQLDRQMLSINKKIALLLDSCNAHSIEYQDQLTNVKIIILSPKSPSGIEQPFVENLIPENQKAKENLPLEITMTRDSTVKVYVRCVFLKIYNIDTVNEQYFADIFIQSKWREPSMDNETDTKGRDLKKLWSPKLCIENLFKEVKETVSLEIGFPEEKGIAYMIQKRRMKAIFSEILELMQFPFDCQDLSVTVASELPSEEVVLVEQYNDPSKINFNDAMQSQEWTLYNHVEVEMKDLRSDCNIGPKSRNAITFTCHASRKFGYFLVNYVMISSMFFLLTFCSFAVTQNTFGRLQLCMTTLLTSVTFKVAISNNLPKVPYLTYLDKVVLGNITLIMSLCLWHASISSLYLNTTTSADVIKTQIWNIEIYLIPALLGFYALNVLVFGLIIYFDAGSRRREMQLKDIEFEERLAKLNNGDNTQ